MLTLRVGAADISERIDQLSEELATGRKSDIRQSTAGDVGALATIDRRLARLDAYETNAINMALTMSARQTSISTVRGQLDLALEALAITDQEGAQATLIPPSAKAWFDTAISALNVEVAGQSLFSGAATDRVALATADDMLADILPIVAAETTAAAVVTAIDTWFAPGAAFETIGYTGSLVGQANGKLDDIVETNLDFAADDVAIRTTLATLMLVTLIGNDALSLSDDERRLLSDTAIERVVSATDELVAYQAEMGITEANISDSQTRVAIEMSFLEISKSNLVAADPFETASALSLAETQLSTIFTLTSRLSSLRLVNFL